MKKSYGTGSAARGTDRRRDCGEIPGSSESGSAVKKETHGRRFRDFPVQGRAERK